MSESFWLCASGAVSRGSGRGLSEWRLLNHGAVERQGYVGGGPIGY
ncbi:hypothetical protein LG3211_1757 [Lysobacter gummosus]|nr:hypothetical protein LG3211_1757 [Lysobacter gummosus]